VRPQGLNWEALFVQFGANYSTLRQFKYEFRGAVQKARRAYPEATIEEGKFGLVLKLNPCFAALKQA
jgi:hypothetical protein